MLYLIIIIVGLFGEQFVRNRLIVPGDARATAARISAMESLWRVHIAAELFLLVCAVAMLMILFFLLRPVSQELAFLAVFFNLVSIGLEAATTMNLVETLFPLGNAAYLKAFAPEQLYAMASLSLKSHMYGFGVSLIFFGCFCLVAGYLIFKSGYLPRTVGVLMQIAGVCYVTNSVTLILSPRLANQVFVLMIPAFVGEASLCLWLLVKSVNLEMWLRKGPAPLVSRAG